MDLASSKLSHISGIKAGLATSVLSPLWLDNDTPSNLLLSKSLEDLRDRILAALDNLQALIASPLPLLMGLTGPNVGFHLHHTPTR